MASYNVYTYHYRGVPFKDNILSEMIKNSIEIKLTPDLSNPDQEYVFFYNTDLKMLQLLIYKNGPNIFRNPMSIDDFLMIVKTHTFYIKSRLLYNCDAGVTITTLEVMDYPTMISDLENINIMETVETNSIMARDGRKFRFREDEDKEYYDVDCLGTCLCFELSKRVKDVWSETFASTK